MPGKINQTMSDWKNKLMLSCVKATEFIEKKQAVGLSFLENFQLKMHLSMCKASLSYEHESLLVNKLLQQGGSDEVDPEKEAALQQALEEKIKNL